MLANGSDHSLARTVSLPGAVMLGLGSMIGTGVFVTIALAAQETGPSVVLAIFLAACVAMCNALSSAQLAAAHPVSGGTYEYGYRLLTPSLGFTAGWMFVCAKVASAATAALGFGAYFAGVLARGGATDDLAGLVRAWSPAAAAALLTALVLAGLRRSNAVNAAVVSVTLGGLLVFIAAGAYSVTCLPRSPGEPSVARHFEPFITGGPRGFLEACALMFVAFTGFGRLATLGEEVKEPRRTIPRAIVLTMLACLVLYTAVGVTAVAAVGADGLTLGSHAGGPLAHAAETLGRAGPIIAWGVSVAACTAMLGVLLNLILGVSRVVLAMGRRGDLPAATATFNASKTTPWVAVLLVGGSIGVAAAVGGIKAAWSFSAFTVLVYYAITNAACLRLPADQRLYPRAFAWTGLAACLGLAFWVETRIWLAGVGLIGVGLAWHALRRRVAR